LWVYTAKAIDENPDKDLQNNANVIGVLLQVSPLSHGNVMDERKEALLRSAIGDHDILTLQHQQTFCQMRVSPLHREKL
jgi:hypothetical protein